MIDKSPYYVHRICFALANGYWPVEVDHRDTDTRNIKGKNLRDSTSQQNKFNAKVKGTNLAGIKGVYAMMGHYRRMPWKTQVKIGGCVYKSGPFATPEEALMAYKQLVAEHHGEFAYMPDIPESEMLRRLKLIVLPKSRPNPTIGSVWITDGKANKRLKPTAELPIGWQLGKVPQSQRLTLMIAFAKWIAPASFTAHWIVGAIRDALCDSDTVLTDAFQQ